VIGDEAQVEADAVAAEWLEDRPWIRCGRCGEVHDADDPQRPGFDLEVEDGKVVAVTCDPCVEVEA
jgi:hypothetical protein